MSDYFHTRRDADDIVWLHLDNPDSRANVLAPALLEAFDASLAELEQSTPRGLVVLSDKPSGFIAGADVRAFAGIDAGRARTHMKRVHEILHRLESLPFPTVALIHGYCLGGGLELALACRYRVARDEPSTRLGFPEVRLGIFPGFGGTVRSLRTLGHLRALDLMLSGRTVSARAARRVGLVDLAVPERHWRAAARHLLIDQPPRQRPPLIQRLAGTAPLRPLVAAALRRRVARKAPAEHYPAPYALIRHWRRHAGSPARMYAREADTVARLLTTDTAQNLIRVFMLQERLKAQGDPSAFVPRRVHVVGGGVMGGDIAAWCALRGLHVTLQDRAPEHLTRAVQRAHRLFRDRLGDRYAVQAAVDRLMPDHLGVGVRRADVVIEAIYEDVDAKRALFLDLERHLKPDAVLATNTSSIPLQVLGEGLQRPERLVGLHFFNPVARMQLVEVVSHSGTDPHMAARAAAFTRHIDRLPLPVNSSPGFLVNRVLMPYLLEAMELLEEGVPAPVIDRAAVQFGMPVGPIELADTVGLEICLSVAEKMAEAGHGEVPGPLRERVAAGDLGRKSGRGFYPWRGDHAAKPHVAASYRPPADLTDRLILRLVNEAVACLREGVVHDPDLLDAGVIFGTGFAPFRGGPLHYARLRGGRWARNRLQQLEKEHGPQFHADDGWASVSL
jgi:3-hydroxyacyl-CoA dehydrogenase / enoyl-CoA hydratase / 3-hydroxybutyryl-CoA epimerase